MDEYNGGQALFIKFKDNGIESFKSLSEANLGRQIAMEVNNEVLSAPFIMDVIDGGEVMISSGLGEELKEYETSINEAISQFPLFIVREESSN